MATIGDALRQELQGYEGTLAAGESLNGTRSDAVKAWQAATDRGLDLSGFPLLGAAVTDAAALTCESWQRTAETEPDWAEVERDRVAELVADDAEMVAKVEDGTITSAARVDAIRAWKAKPQERLTAHKAQAAAEVAERQRRWQATAIWTLSPEHQRMVLKRGFTEQQARWMFTAGFIRSLTWEQVQRDWLGIFPMAKQTQTGGMLLTFDPQNPKPEARTYSLRCDRPPVEKRITGDRAAKYLYAAGQRDPLSGEFSDDKGNPKNNQQPFIPNGMAGPDGRPLGNAEIATEGLFDALVCTLQLGIPCVGLTAPGHLRGSELPKGVRVYIGDADQWLAPGLLPTVVGQCCSKGLNLSRLPLREGHNYKVKPSDLHPDAKAGMEELTADLGADAARDVVLALAATAGTPGDYLDWEIEQLRELGLQWPEHEPAIANLISAVADGHRSSAVGRDALIERLHRAFGVGKRALSAGVKARLERIDEKRSEEKRMARAAERDAALARGDVPLPEIDKDCPTNQQLQGFVEFQHRVRFNELTRLVELDGTPLEHQKLAYQWMADQHGIQCQKQQAIDVLDYAAQRDPYNPVAEYLAEVKADETLAPVTSSELAHWFGIAPGDDLSMELFWRSLAGTALRGVKPGSKFDQCPILHGDQGLGKSEGLKQLVGSQWYVVLGDMKDLHFESWAFLAKLNRCWLMELGEVGRLTRGKSADDFKVFLSTTNDVYAEKKEPLASEHERRGVTWGTTNDQELLNDPTGVRRFWIMRVVNQVHWLEIGANRDRIWRTVQLWMDRGMRVWLDRNDAAQADTLKAAADRGEVATFDDPWVGVLLDHTNEVVKAYQSQLKGTHPTAYGCAVGPRFEVVEVPTDDGGMVEGVFITNNDLLAALDIDKGKRGKGDSMKASTAMKHPAIAETGWQPYRRRYARGYLWCSEPPTGSDKSEPERSQRVVGSEGVMPWSDWELVPLE
jgi:Virulence-associated protein E